MNKILFKINGLKRPSNSLKARVLLFINKIPIVRNLGFIKKMLCKNFKMPLSTSFNSGFYCSSSYLDLGENVGIADTYILAYAQVTIGNNCSFSFRNMIITSSHDLGDFSTIIASPITIGNNVWITTNVTILGGVTIGDNSVIGAGSIVTKDIPSGVFASGNPCKVIKKIEFYK